MTFKRRVSHLCMFNVLLISIVVYDSESTPVCGRMNGSSVHQDSDQFYFPDQGNGLRRMRVNGTIITCHSDGTIISATPINESQSSTEIDEYQLKERIETDDKRISHGAMREVPTHLFLANVSKCANKDQSFCTKNDDYPIDHIRKLLRTFSHEYSDVFGTDLTTNDVSFRINSAVEDEVLCETYEDVVYPTSGKRQDGTDRFIFNIDGHKQGVRVSLCQNLGKPCTMAVFFPNGYRTECKQQMVYRELLSLSPEGKAVKDHFEFPACCSCVLHKG